MASSRAVQKLNQVLLIYSLLNSILSTIGLSKRPPSKWYTDLHPVEKNIKEDIEGIPKIIMEEAIDG